jgi:DNA-binding response OmpR family regulator
MRILLVAHRSHQQLKLAAALTERGAVVLNMPRIRLTRTVVHEADILILGPELNYDESIAICQAVRASSDTPIIMISSQTGRLGRIQGLQSGADDYVACPYDLDELVARVIAAARPRGRPRNGPMNHSLNGTSNNVLLDIERMELAINGRSIELTKKEFKIMALLVAADGSVCSRKRIAKEVWGKLEEEVHGSLQVLMSRLRAKVGYHRIKTVRGVGYQFVTPPKERMAPMAARNYVSATWPSAPQNATGSGQGPIPCNWGETLRLDHEYDGDAARRTGESRHRTGPARLRLVSSTSL